ncbi:hypothetical protein KCP70_05155 [Salmonella enterica subsp. enterica]|nr:hypothetical protein KCP70_05155 [Salmonella enterica subsp. enterica]
MKLTPIQVNISAQQEINHSKIIIRLYAKISLPIAIIMLKSRARAVSRYIASDNIWNVAENRQKNNAYQCIV